MAERVAHPGPQDRLVLFMKPDEHRAYRVWHESSFRDVKLRCHHDSSEAYVEEGLRHPGVVQLLRVSGFHDVKRIGQLQLDWSLVTALVERWRHEVHAFHLPFGEVGLTLQDVQVLLGLPVDGIPLTGLTITEKAALLQMCADSVGFDGGCRYGILTTNLSESFNNALKGCRPLPITALVRATFDKLVQLFAQRRTAGMMWQQAGYHFPDNIRKELMECWQQRPHTVVLPHNYYTGIYLVSVENAIPVTVNLSRRVCDCGCWRMNGMPCVHAHSVCHFLNCPVDYLIPEVYKLSSYINAHSSDIMPFPNMNEWPQNEFILLPPKYSSRTSRAGRRQEIRFPNEMDMHPRRRGQHD